ncbi:PDZ domain-containing protein [Rhodobacterales bacterium FZCC0069]|nr:PDZ domain-containing protein [Rhodobacterales bacterium FZCC0069]
MKQFLSALFLCLAPFSVHAGDPCPIPIVVHDLGVPDWLDRDALLDGLQSQRTWVGISYNYTPDGLALTAVHPDSPAQRAGLQVGDVIRSINALATGSEMQDRAAFDSLRSGETVLVEVMRTDQETATLPLTVGYTDPVPLGMVNALRRQECRTARLIIEPAAEQQALLADLFTASRGFRCDDAHIALAERTARYEVQDVYVLRGSRRILITMPHWGTHCLASTALDGDNLTDAALLLALDPVIGAYVQDRHDNP